MRITKKVVSLVLATLMVATMMSVMAVSVSALEVTIVDLSELTESYVITEGGNYQITGTTTLAKPVVINTSEAVTIQDSTIVTTKTGDTGYAVTVTAANSNVTIKDSTLQSYARAIEYDYDVTPQTGTLTVDNTKMVTCGLEEANYQTTLVNGGSATKRAVNFGKVKINATFTDSTFAGYHYAINFTQQAAGDSSTVTATRCGFYARAALNNWGPNLTATFNDCTVYAINNFGGSSESFAAFVVYDGADNTKVYLNDTEVIASYNGAGATNDNAVNNLLDVRGNNCTIEANNSSYKDTTNKGSIVSEDNILEYLLDGDTNTVVINGGTYECNFPTTYDASAYAAYISDPDIDASNVSITQFYANVIEVQSGTFTDEVPAEYLDNRKDVQLNNETGKYEIVEADETYVARIGSDRYTTLQNAINAAQAGDTITLLADINTDTTFTIAEDKVLTIDGGAYTVTTTAITLFENSGTLNLNGGSYVALSTIVDNKAGTASLLGGAALSNTSTVKNDWNPAIYVEDGTVNISNAAIVSNNACAVLEEGNGIVEMTGGTVQAEWYGFDVVESAVFNFSGGSVTSNQEQNYSAINPVYAVCIEQEATINMSDDAYMSGFNGGLIFNGGNGNISGGTIIVPNGGSYRSIYVTSIDKERYTGEDGGYDVNLNITGGTFTSPKEVLQVGKSYPGTSIVDIEGGTFTSTTKKNNIVVSTSGSSPYDVNVSGGSFNYAVPTEYCAEDFYPVSDGNGGYTVDSVVTPTLTPVEVSENNFGFNTTFNNGTILGVQLKNHVEDAAETSESGQENGKDLRFVAAVETELLKAADDYGFVLANADATKGSEDRTCANTNFDGLLYEGGNGEKVLSAKGTYNNVSGAAYGNPTDDTTLYKFVTCAVNGVADGKKIVARFYVKVNGKVYYVNYTNGVGTYSGCVAGINNSGNVY